MHGKILSGSKSKRKRSFVVFSFLILKPKYKFELDTGISSGANIIGAILAQNKLGEQAVVVTTLNDSNKKYLSTDLLKEEQVKEGYYSTEVEFVDYKVISRL